MTVSLSIIVAFKKSYRRTRGSIRDNLQRQQHFQTHLKRSSSLQYTSDGGLNYTVALVLDGLYRDPDTVHVLGRVHEPGALI